jgi:hypothetical protein
MIDIEMNKNIDFEEDEIVDHVDEGTLEISPYDEMDYDLEDIGLENIHLCIEGSLAYFYSEADEGLYIELKNIIMEEIALVSNTQEGNICYKYDEDFIVVTKEQYEIIQELLSDKQ